MEQTQQQEQDFVTQRAGHYIELLNSIALRVGDTSVAVAILHEVSKDDRVRRMAESREEHKSNGYGFVTANSMNGNERASERQLAFIRDLGGKARKNLTREQASEKITALLEEQRDQAA